MTGQLVPFANSEFDLSLEPDSGGSFRVMAPGLARALGMRDAFRLLESIPDDEKGYTTACTPGGDQRIGYLTEAGFYRALGQRQASRISDLDLRTQVERFQSWVYGTVLPEIRKTGGYQPLSREQRIALALQDSQDIISEQREQIAILAPKAEVADRLLDADGDMSVADTAKALTRAGIKVGEGRLFTALSLQLGWIYRAKGDGRWRVYQTAIESGHMSVIPQSHYHPKTGVLVLDPPQPRVTPKGLQKLLAVHGAETSAVIAVPA